MCIRDSNGPWPNSPGRDFNNSGVTVYLLTIKLLMMEMREVSHYFILFFLMLREAVWNVNTVTPPPYNGQF